MVTFSPDGKFVVTADEGEPDDDYGVDPDGSVSVIDVSGGVENVPQTDVMTADFSGFTVMNLDPDEAWLPRVAVQRRREQWADDRQVKYDIEKLDPADNGQPKPWGCHTGR